MIKEEVYFAYKKLETEGYGVIVAGRNGNPTRFKWNCSTEPDNFFNRYNGVFNLSSLFVFYKRTACKRYILMSFHKINAVLEVPNWMKLAEINKIVLIVFFALHPRVLL